MEPTFEQRIRLALPNKIGRYLVVFERYGISRKFVVDLSPKMLRLFPEPTDTDMYIGWLRLNGDEAEWVGPTLVWAASRPEVREMFQGEPLASIPYPVPAKAA